MKISTFQYAPANEKFDGFNFDCLVRTCHMHLPMKNLTGLILTV